ncbi:MAG: hypothetical protein KF914_01835 [Rhizobiaceae bacterium]|nr:hypothetical protein [Rhizobiaceae bacterium]
MPRRLRRNHRPAVKAKAALASVKGKNTLADLAALSMFAIAGLGLAAGLSNTFLAIVSDRLIRAPSTDP